MELPNQNAPPSASRDGARGTPSHTRPEPGPLTLTPSEPRPPKATPKRATNNTAKKNGEPKAEQRYAEAYAAGQVDAGADGFPPPRQHSTLIETAKHFGKAPDGAQLRADDLLAWFRSSSADYRRAVDPKFSSGYQPSGFLRWLQAGRPNTRAGRGSPVLQQQPRGAPAWRPNGTS